MYEASLVSRVSLCALAAAALVATPTRAHDGCRVADVNSDGYVTLLDYMEIVVTMGQSDPRKDLDGNGVVGKEDVAIMMSFNGSSCASSCPADLDGDGDVDAEDRKHVATAFGLDCRPDLDRDGFVDSDGAGSDDDDQLLRIYNGSPVPPGTPEARADFDTDNDVDNDDLAFLTAAVPRDCRADLNKDGQVDVTDIWALLAAYGTCP